MNSIFKKTFVVIFFSFLLTSCDLKSPEVVEENPPIHGQAITDLSNEYSLGCTATPNGLSFNYPCNSNEPTAPKGASVLTTWSMNGYLNGNKEAGLFGDSRQFIVERYESELSVGEYLADGTFVPKDWIDQNLASKVDIHQSEQHEVSGWRGQIFKNEGGQLLEGVTTWYIVVQTNQVGDKKPVYLITLSFAHKDETIKREYQNQMMAMLDSLELLE